MSLKGPFDLIGKRIERATRYGWKERGTIKAVRADGKVIVGMDDGQTVVVHPAGHHGCEVEGYVSVTVPK